MYVSLVCPIIISIVFGHVDFSSLKVLIDNVGPLHGSSHAPADTPRTAIDTYARWQKNEVASGIRRDDCFDNCLKFVRFYLL